MEPLTRAQVRLVDQLAISELAIPGVVLMENAGRGAADHIMAMIQDELHLPLPGAPVAILCGSGNNGGDGYVIARHLHNHGAPVRIFTTRPLDQLTGDAHINAQIAHHMQLPIHDLRAPAALAAAGPQWDRAAILVDALLGTGFTGSVRPDLAAVIRRANDARSQGARIVAIDLPSGLDCDTGSAPDPTIHADLTVTFVAPKIGFSAPSVGAVLGRVVVVDIGAPPQTIARARQFAAH